jgi:hypothetical protein
MLAATCDFDFDCGKGATLMQNIDACNICLGFVFAQGRAICCGFSAHAGERQRCRWKTSGV